MKTYTKEVFLSLDFKRQVKLSLDMIYEVEKTWSLGLEKEKSLSALIQMLNWLLVSKESKELKAIHLITSIDQKSSLREILNLATAFERQLSLSLKDDSILVKTSDKHDSKFESTSTLPIYVVLDNLRSAFNVGSIFRTSDCLGVKHIYLVGYTPTPDEAPVKKTAMGTDKIVSWSVVPRVSEVISKLKEENIDLVALETTKESINIYDAKTKPGVALFFGNERFGLEVETLKKMDQILEIPMKGFKNSLNVSNAFSISASEIIRSWERV